MPKNSFLAHLPQIFMLGPSPLDGLNLYAKNMSSVGHKILNKMSGCLWKSDKWLPSYAKKKKTIWAHLTQIYVLGPSPHATLNFFKK